jgi:lysophospholipase L1-like esterase
MDTRGSEGTEGFGEVSFPETDQPVQLELGGGGGVRLFGVAAERTGPGMVLDGLGITGAKYVNLNGTEEAHWQRQLRDRAVSLVIFMYGANDGDFTVLPEDWYRKVITRTLTRLKPLRGQVGCLVITPIDRGIPWKPGMPSRPIMAHIEKVQEELARAHGCAVLRLRDAMGGPGSARRWLLAKPPLMWGDVTHLRPAGARVIGGVIGRALIRSYESYKKAQGDRACPRAAAGAALTSRP